MKTCDADTYLHLLTIHTHAACIERVHTSANRLTYIYIMCGCDCVYATFLLVNYYN